MVMDVVWFHVTEVGWGEGCEVPKFCATFRQGKWSLQGLGHVTWAWDCYTIEECLTSVNDLRELCSKIALRFNLRYLPPANMYQLALPTFNVENKPTATAVKKPHQPKPCIEFPCGPGCDW